VNPYPFLHVDAALRNAVDDGILAGATLIAARGAGGRHEISIGQAQITPTVRPLTSTTLYDLASLTKVLATIWLAMKWATSGQLDVDAPIGDLLPDYYPENKRPSPCVCSCAAPQDCHPGFACDGIRHRTRVEQRIGAPPCSDSCKRHCQVRRVNRRCIATSAPSSSAIC
tara:strand:+ start:81 stop:590 length:510 start_codon:yes stop_codon:yes gene_type:complete